MIGIDEPTIFHPERVKIGKRCRFGMYVILRGYSDAEIIIGNGCFVGDGCYFNGFGGIEIASTDARPVGIGPYVKILTSQHRTSGCDAVMNNPLQSRKVYIGAGADIGMGSILLPGVTIGRGAIVGAGSVVTKDIPRQQIWAGNPAKFLRLR